MASQYILKVFVPEQVPKAESGELIDRESFFGWLWQNFQTKGLTGVHEGTVLSAEAYDQGFETEPWIADQGPACEKRDWVGAQSRASSEFYFSSLKEAEVARTSIAKAFPLLEIRELYELEEQDWNAVWKSNFKGIVLNPYWLILPPWESAQKLSGKQRKMIINPGAGFGTGTHETTQLCLKTLSEWHERYLTDKKWNAFDFGSGSGILSVAAALLGAEQVDAVEIDELANDNAYENARLNDVKEKVSFSTDMDRVEKNRDVVFANILKPTLIEFCDVICEKLSPTGILILSGLIEPDVEIVEPHYRKKLGADFRVEYRSLNEWRAIIFSSKSRL